MRIKNYAPFSPVSVKDIALERFAPFTRNMKKVIDITFKSVADFRNRIARLWQDQKDDEEYNFIFKCSKAEEEFDKLISSFQRYDREQT